MVEAHHEIAELDLNPVMVAADGVVAVDARIRVETAAPRRSWPRAWSSACLGGYACTAPGEVSE